MACVHRGVVQALHASEGTLTELFNVRVPVDRVRGTGQTILQPAGSLARFTILQVQLRPSCRGGSPCHMVFSTAGFGATGNVVAQAMLLTTDMLSACAAMMRADR